MAFRQALEDRLRHRVAGVGAQVARVSERVATDRFLARLTAVAPDRWQLQGGYAHSSRAPSARTPISDVLRLVNTIAWAAEGAPETDLADRLLTSRPEKQRRPR